MTVHITSRQIPGSSETWSLHAGRYLLFILALPCLLLLVGLAVTAAPYSTPYFTLPLFTANFLPANSQL